eukprot:scaffold12229_cov32-Tisochrysis_lutea.AAC.6
MDKRKNGQTLYATKIARPASAGKACPSGAQRARPRLPAVGPMPRAGECRRRGQPNRLFPHRRSLESVRRRQVGSKRVRLEL